MGAKAAGWSWWPGWLMLGMIPLGVYLAIRWMEQGPQVPGLEIMSATIPSVALSLMAMGTTMCVIYSPP